MTVAKRNESDARLSSVSSGSPMTGQDTMRTAFRFVLIIGIVNLFADMTYEGGRGITGPFLGSLGASATAVGVIAGFGELLGYGLRSVSGYLADRTHRYWAVVFVGYFVNMLAVPALALAGSWPMAGALIVVERVGRAIRRPAVEAMISHAGRSVGQGWVFGLNEALDQAGATIGPLIAALVLYLRGSYHEAFAILLIPAVLCLGTLVAARALHPSPRDLEERSATGLDATGFSTAYWIYLAAGALIAMGVADFALIAFHFHKAGTLAPSGVPIFYAAAMAMGAIASLTFGRSFDRHARFALLVAFALSSVFAPFVFLGGFRLALVGMLLWGLGMGVQDSLLKAALARVVSADRRSTAFGVFDTVFGVAWFVGSALMGLLYDISLPALIVFSVVVQLAALPVLLTASRHAAQVERR